MATLVADFEAEIGIRFFGEPDFVGDAFAVDDFALAAFIKSEIRIDQIAVVFEQPINPVVGSAALFIRGER